MTDEDKALVEELRHICCDGEWHAAKPQVNHPVCKDAADRIEAQAAEIEDLKQSLEIWIFHNQRAMGQKPEVARQYAKAWLFRNAGGEEPE